MATELLPIEDWPKAIPELTGFRTQVALDLDNGHRVVGALVGYVAEDFKPTAMFKPKIETVMVQLPNQAVVNHRVDQVEQAWIAPMGYRAPARGWKDPT